MTGIRRAGLIEAVESRGPGRLKRLERLGIPRSSYYRWRRRYDAEGTQGLERRGRGKRAWNRLLDSEEAEVLRAANDRPELSPRLLSMNLIDERGLSISESTVYRILKCHGLIRLRPADEKPAAKQCRHKTTRPDEIWQCDAVHILIPDWGYYKAIPVLDDYARKLLALPLKPDETSFSIADAVELALEKAREEGHTIESKPTLLSDNGPGFAGDVLCGYLRGQGMKHIFGAPFHPQTQGKVERLNRKIREQVCLVVYASPDELQRALERFQQEYNATPHEALKNVSPNDVYAGRQEEILKRRAEVKRLTLQRRRAENLGRTA
jgi:putative transposase